MSDWEIQGLRSELQQLRLQLQQVTNDSNTYSTMAYCERRDRFAAEAREQQLTVELRSLRESLQGWVNACNRWKAKAEQLGQQMRANDTSSAEEIQRLTDLIASLREERKELVANLASAQQESDLVSVQLRETDRALAKSQKFAIGLANGLDALVAEARACPREHPLAEEIELVTGGDEPEKMPAVARIVYAGQE